jgi:PAS domain S-box-containing protein
VDFVNRHWQEYTGLSGAQTWGSGWEAVVHTEDLKRHLEKWRASLATGKPFENEVRYRRATDGQYRWFLARAVLLRGARGNILKWYGISTDIEDRKRAEEERETLRQDLAHINRVSTMGELTASLAHEIKQPISAAATDAETCFQWLARDRPDVPEAQEAALRIMKDTTRASDIINRIVSLFRKHAPRRELVDVNDVIQEMIGLLRSEAGRYSISIDSDLSDGLPKVMAERVGLQQILMNLMLNAIEAMREIGAPGKLMIATRQDDHQLHISVIDTGVGLPPGQAEHVFKPFFTSKPQGTGMGLPISRSIVESHGGRLWATANSGRGTTFQFTLPLGEAASEGT